MIDAPAAGMLRLASAAALGLAIGATTALAQAQPRQQPKPQQPPQQQQQQQQSQNAQGEAHLLFSPWAKFCNKGPELNAVTVCFTGRDGRTDAGDPLVAAVLIEPEGAPKKILRVTLVGPLQLPYGARIVLDQNQPEQRPFYTCFGVSCVADWEATPDVIGKLKKGQMLHVQGITLAGKQISVPLPLAGFAKANEGPPADPKEYEEQHKKLQEELRKRQGQPAQPGQPAQH